MTSSCKFTHDYVSFFLLFVINPLSTTYCTHCVRLCCLSLSESFLFLFSLSFNLVSCRCLRCYFVLLYFLHPNTNKTVSTIQSVYSSSSMDMTRKVLLICSIFLQGATELYFATRVEFRIIERCMYMS